MQTRNECATFAAGCFWGVEAAFREIKGVLSTTVGYTGGSTPDPVYEEVCSGSTGHAEAVRVEYNPVEVSFGDLLGVFWKVHDPTTLNRQGPDIGTQYRSAIFFHNERQEIQAKHSKEEIEKSGRYPRKIVTDIVPAGEFHRAEEYHQQYLEKQGRTSCGIH